jgi:type I restriction enzyme S subunit
MNNFQRAPLEEWMDSIIDYRGKTPEKTTSGIPLVTAKVIKGGRIEIPDEFIAPEAYDEWMRRGIPKAGDVVITTEAPLGEVAQLPKGKVALAQRVITLSGKSDSVDNTYLKYLLLSRPFQEDLHARATGTTVVGIKQSVLRKISLSFPGLSQQQVIAHILGTLDDKIELNRKTNETLEAMAKALFQSWFVDFDPVHAKAEGRPTGLPDEISDLFPDSFEEAELGEIPRGWAMGRLEEILEIDPRRSLPKGSVAPYLEMKGVPTAGHCATDVINREFTSGSKFRNGDTLLARITPCLENGKTAFVDFLADGQVGWGSTEFIVLCGKDEPASYFAYFLARSEGLRNHAILNMVGSSGRQRVPSDALESYILPIPNKCIFDAFGSYCSWVMAKIKNNAIQSASLAGIRDTLLPKLISGELRIPEAEKVLEEVGI